MMFVYEVNDLSEVKVILNNLRTSLIDAMYIVPETMNNSINSFIEENNKIENIIKTEIMIAKKPRYITGEDKLVNRTKTMYNSFNTISDNKTENNENIILITFENNAVNEKDGFKYPYYLEHGDIAFKPFAYTLYAIDKNGYYKKPIEKLEYNIINNFNKDIIERLSKLI